MRLGYALSEVQKHGTDAQWWRKRFLTHVVSRYFTGVNRPACDPLVERDWDNVVLLDACRYDLFAEVLADNPLPGRLEKRRACASGTPNYLTRNFGGGTFHDVVYVTANPYVETELPAGTFHAVEHVWRDAWNDEHGTVMPDTVCDRALDAAKRYPDKRLVVHFNQPHAPFVGDVRVDSRGMSGIRETALGNDGPDPRDRQRTPFERLGAGEVTRDEVWAGYRSNLEAAMPAVERLLSEFEGLTAVTADHGNALGERAWPFPVRVYGHPLGVLIPALTDVPWHVVETGSRKTVTAEEPEPPERDVDEDTAERLRMLGYAE